MGASIALKRRGVYNTHHSEKDSDRKYGWSRRRDEVPAVICNVLTYLENTAARLPNQTAFADGQVSLTYARLREQSRRVGTALSVRLEGRRRQPVFVCIGRSVESLAAFFGVAASGNFYVPVDLSLPERRLRDLYETMRPRVVITTRDGTRSGERPVPFPEAEIVPLEELALTPEDGPLMDRIAAETIGESPLYCIFTSGSTGVPKGVLVSHRSVVNMAEQFTETFGFGGTEVFGNQAPFDFDVSVKDIYLTVKNGARLEILERTLFSAPRRLIERMEERGVNTVIWSVSAMKILSALKTFERVRPEGLRRVMFSGEALPCKVLNDWAGHLPRARFVNLYGPTEITCNCTWYEIDRPFADHEAIPIGRPFPNTRVFLLDGDREVTAPGEAGEICVAGTCLALGYYNDPERTAAAFCQDPLQSAWPERIYRTGDLGCWDQRGELMFLGRADSQVKYMGFRIELGEIEIAANAIPMVSSACCLFDQEREQLCLFYQAEQRDDQGVAQALRKTLPQFMVPTRLYWFRRLPENRTGKIDRAALRRDYIQK